MNFRHTLLSGYPAKTITWAIVFLFVVVGIFQTAMAHDDGAPSGNTGSPGDDQTCAHVDCHTGSAVPKDSLVFADVPETGYVSTGSYLITVTITETDRVRFGFQASPQNLAGDKKGSIDLINTVDTKKTGGGKYITHTLSGNSGEGSRTWTFIWNPLDSHGDVTIYVAVNAADDDGHASGDHIYTNSVTIHEDPANFPLGFVDAQTPAFGVQVLADHVLECWPGQPVPQDVELRLFDLHGREVMHQDIAGMQYVTRIPLTNVESGMYIVTLRSGEKYFSSKILCM
ncbi:MAG: choice-of-anchor V domain-containing protein [Chitinophagales bacterium]